MDPAAGVSELIGAILLITITVMAVSLVGVILLSQQGPQEVPNINFMTGTNAARDQLYLYHNGGDTLTRGEFAVVLDGRTRRTDYSISDGSSNWSVGKNLVLSITTPPKTVSLIYIGGRTGDVLLRSASSNVSSPGQNINPDNTPVVPFEGPTGPSYIFNDVANLTNSSYFIDAIKVNVTNSSISFWRDDMGNGNGATGLSCHGLCHSSNKIYFFRFTVTDTSGASTISYGSPTTITTVPLNNGDVVNVSVTGGDVKYFTAFGIAPSIWELAGDPLTLDITFANGTVYKPPGNKNINTEITHTRVEKYNPATLKSTLAIDVWKAADTGLTVNGTRYINGVDSRDILLTNVRPVPMGLYLISSLGGENIIYFVGNADKIYFNGISQSLP
jgi:hypothetical protein